jgi:signal transduction histidine kinase
MQRGLTVSLPRQREGGDEGREKRQAQLLHDVRGTVGAILLLGAAAEHEVADRDVVARRLREIMSQTRWLVSLLESQWDDDAPRPVDVAQAVHDCAERVRLQSHAAIVVESEGAVEVTVPPVGLQRAVTNVVANAARAAGPAGNVLVRTHESDRDVVVEVLDDGPGFGQVPIEHGLGLGITRDAMAAAGGAIEIEDRPDGGTRVCLRLPRHVIVLEPRGGA